MNLTTNWGWPQWVLTIFMFLHVLVHASKNGQDMKAEYNGLVAILRSALWIFVLSSGGFFR